MSALPPKADIRQRDCDVRFVPKADNRSAGRFYTGGPITPPASLSAYLLMLAAARGRSRANRTSIAVSRRWQYASSRSGDFTARLFRRGAAAARPVRSDSSIRIAPSGDAFIISVRASICARETSLRRRRARPVTSGAPAGARRLLGKTLPWPRPRRSRGELSANKQCHCGEGNPSRSEARAVY